MQYEKTVKAQAEILVSLEGLSKVLTALTLDVAHIEDVVYGQSNDVHDNMEDVTGNSGSQGDNRHSFTGMAKRVHSLQDTCYSN